MKKGTVLASRLLAVLALAASPLCGQTAKDVLSALDFGKYELDEKRTESAAKSLRSGYAALKLLSSKEKRAVGKAEKELITLLKKVDPNGKKLVDATVKAAKALQKLGQKYAKLGWNDTAFQIFEQAQLLHPKLVADDIAAVRKLLNKDGARRFADAGKNKLTLNTFYLGERVALNRDPWTLSNFGILAPKTNKKRGTAGLMSKMPIKGNVKIQLEIKPGPSGKASFCWNMQPQANTKPGYTSYDLCRIELNPRGAEARIMIQKGDNETGAGRGTLVMDSFKNSWIPVTIEQRGTDVTITLPKNDPIKFRSFAKNDGHLCLGFETANTADPQAEFRHLKIEYLDK